MVVVLVACSRVPKAEQVIVVDAVTEDGSVSLGGRMSFERNPATGRLEPDYWEPGTLYLFRVSTDAIGEVAAEAGEIYRVQPDQTLKKVGSFDLGRSKEELVKRYAKD